MLRRGAAVGGMAIVALAGAACSSNPPPVPLHADAPGMEALRGSWSGDYWSEETGRHGTIRFELTAAGDTARGEVVMIPDGPGRPVEPVTGVEWCGPEEEGTMASGRSLPRAKLLSIHFVRAYGNRVQGTLNAYKDPATGHRLVTTFRGDLAGDSIRGTYSSYDCEEGTRTAGDWRVARRN